MADTTQKKHILVAEDDETARTYFADLLSSAGYKVTAVPDGLQAKERIEVGDIDAVLTDIGMPGLNGIQLFQAVGETEKNPPCVMVTGNADLEEAAKSVNGRAVAYLRKPVQRAQLLDAITRAVVIADVASHRRALKRLLAQQEFDRAISTLHLDFQKVVESPTFESVAFEAFARNDSNTLTKPPVLLRAAKELNLRDQLGRKIRTLVAQGAAKLPPTADIFVNIDADDLHDLDLYSSTTAFGALANRIVLEVSEKMPLQDVSGLQDRLQKLRKLGFRMSVDGLWHASLGMSVVMAVEPSYVKLDKETTIAAESSEDVRKWVSQVAEMLRDTCNARLVAKCVETEKQRDGMLRTGDVRLFQGFFFDYRK